MSQLEKPEIVEGKIIKVMRKNPDNIRLVPANDLVVTHTKNEFYLTFSIFEPPPILDKEELAQLEEADAIATAKLVISPEFAEAVVTVLSRNVEAYKQHAGQEDK